MKSKAGEFKNTGSSPNDEPVFVIIGKFRRPHGIKGEIVMTVLIDFPELIHQGRILYVGERYTPYEVRSVRWHGGDLLVALEELPDRTAVEIFRNIMVYMKAKDLPEPPEGEFYIHQLVGLDVITDEGQELGKIKEILVTGANDVYLVESEGGKQILLPAIEQVVLDIDHDSGKVKVHILPGLLDYQ
jgi:16S rRNA processing protein RimM